MPLLSVVVPTRDRSERLRAALQSLRAQTFADFEVIVVDDGSTDDTPALLAELSAADPRITSVRLPGGSGAAGARNRGISAASGAYLAFLDDDDEWRPNKAAEQIDYLRAHPNVGLVSCNFVIDDTQRGTSHVHRGPQEVTPAALLWANMLMGCSFVMLRRDAFSFELDFDHAVVPAEDWDLWLRCSDERGVYTIPSVLCRYARHGPQLTGNTETLRRGDTGFLVKHSERMGRGVRAYHEAHLRMLAAGRNGSERMRARMRILTDTPPSVLSVMARVSAAGRIGTLIGDPGRPFRTLARAAERLS